MISELDYELILVETIQVCFEDLELETGSEMKLEVIVPNESKRQVAEQYAFSRS